MEENYKLCSSTEHEKETIALSFCPKCDIYMCKKCEISHSKLLKKHEVFLLGKDNNEIFTGFCKEKNHQKELEFFCKNHNQLCCAACISKIKGEGNGQHTDCDIVFIKEILDEKRNKLKENIKMKKQKKKCSLKEHLEIDAISFCQICKIYMCNKCDNIHSSLFEKHNTHKTNKENEIFTEFCKEKNHSSKLNYFCKNHNQLCCSSCLCKLNKIGDGQHKDCDVCYIEDIKEEKKNKLKENIKCLEELQNKFNESIESLKKIFQNIEKDKEDLKLEIQNIFTKIRTTLNDREDELLSEVDNLFNTKYFHEDIIKKGEKLQKQIKISLEKGKLIDKEWDNNNLYSYINDCINIENSIKNINIINESINKCNINNKIKFKFEPNENQLDDFLKIIKLFGKINFNKYSLREFPNNINEERKYIITGEKKNILTKTGTDGWRGTICENELDKSIEEHKWKIKILKTKCKNIMVGVAPKDYNFNIYNYNKCGWYLYCLDSPPKLWSGPSYNYQGLNTNLSGVNNEIVVVMNMKKRTLKFIINNEDKGDSYTNIPIDKPLFPAIELYNKDDSVEIIELD